MSDWLARNRRSLVIGAGVVLAVVRRRSWSGGRTATTRAARPGQPRSARRPRARAGARRTRASRCGVVRAADALEDAVARPGHHGRRHLPRPPRPEHRRPAARPTPSGSRPRGRRARSRARSRRWASARRRRSRSAAAAATAGAALRRPVSTAWTSRSTRPAPTTTPTAASRASTAWCAAVPRPGVTLLGAADMLTNDQVLRADNAAVALRLLGQHARGWSGTSRASTTSSATTASACARCCPTGSCPGLWLARRWPSSRCCSGGAAARPAGHRAAARRR